MSHVDDASHLKSAAIEKGLRVRDTKSHPTATRFVISLGHEIDTERLYVHASPNKISITIDLTDGATEILSYEQALERIDPTLDDVADTE